MSANAKEMKVINYERKKENKDEVGAQERGKYTDLCGVDRGEDKGKFIFKKKNSRN